MNVVVLASAEGDLKELRRYIVKNFPQVTWLKTYGNLKDSIRKLATFPHLESVPEELETLQLNQYRQILSGMDRIIYETRQDTVYVHAIVDTRRDMKAFLMQRLVQ